MKAALISQGSVSSKLLAEAMKKYFSTVDHLMLQQLEVMTAGNTFEVLHAGEPLQTYDCAYIKGSYAYASLMRAVSASLPEHTYIPLQPSALTIGHDKLMTHLVLQKHKIPMPRTYLSSTPASFAKILDKVNYPIVIKLPAGTGGKGVMFAESKATARALLDTLVALKQPFIIQEYVETEGVDIRLIVVGDNVVAGMKRQAAHDDKRANIHAGGKGEAYVPSPTMKKLALRTAQAVGARICGVDLLEGPTSPLVVEVNMSPGLQGISVATKVDVADRIAKFLHDDTVAYRSSRSKGTTASSILAELGIQEDEEPKSLITTLDLRSDRILLPKMVTDVTKFNEQEDVEITVEKDKLTLRKFMNTRES